jgi:fructokinase
MKEREQILCFGEILWDCLPGGRQPGGAPMNVAFHLNRFGLKSKVASSVGNDQDGLDLMGFLRKSGLDTQLIQVNEHLPTSTVKVSLDKNNNATFEICEPVAWDDIAITPELFKEADNSKAIVFGSLVARNISTRDSLLKLLGKDLIKILDVNLRPPFASEDIVKTLLEKADILKLNDDELIIITNWYKLNGNIAERMHAFQKIFQFDSLIVTRGQDGAYLIHGNEFYKHDGFRVDTVDTVGSGDAFLAGFLAALFENKDMKQALTDACAIGALVATRAGATPEYDKSSIQSLKETGNK